MSKEDSLPPAGLHLPNLGDDDLTNVATVLAALVTVEFAAGEALFAQGAPGDSVFVVTSGAVEVRGRTPDGDVLRISRAGSGDIIGELAVFDPGPRGSTAIATTDVVAGRLDRTALRRLAATHAGLHEELLKLLARQVKRRHDELGGSSSR